MSEIFKALSTWMHSLATIVMVGYFIFARLIYLPELEHRLSPPELRLLLEGVSARLKPYFGASLLVFIITGFHLMLVNEAYLGLGNFIGNQWSILITIKHGLVLAFLGLAVSSERRYLGQTDDAVSGDLAQFRRSLSLDILLGVLILQLTSIAQAG